MYVFDTMVLSQQFRFYYRQRFPSLWSNFESLVAEGQITSTREVRRELENSNDAKILAEINKYRKLFPTPTVAEEEFVGSIFAIRHFRQNIPNKTLLKGGRNADPWLIARAALVDGIVVTNETFRDHAAGIPNICQRFDITYLSFDEFMGREGWVF
ncbi:MAG: DUF4411 family protein [Candidatus Poribacteria bacterium]|nr:DUF4411 family protein [Candidatus Poribacteria bacterium]